MYVPKTLEEFIGQKDAIKQIQQVIGASKLKGKPLPHILLTGPRGTGKTTLAKLVSRTMEETLVLTAPSALQTNEDLFRLFSDNLNSVSATIFFIDEIHRLGIKAEEDLYLPMENSTFIRKGTYRGGYNMSPFTILAATTLPGKLSEPLRDRFGLTIHMAKYSIEDMSEIVSQAAKKNGIEITNQAIVEIAIRSRRNPRVANHLLDRCQDHALVEGLEGITEESTKDAFDIMGIDNIGLNNTDRKYLSYLYEAGRPIGVQSLVPILDLDKETIQSVIEPCLIEVGFINLTGRGRLLSQKGMAFVESMKSKDGVSAMKTIGA